MKRISRRTFCIGCGQTILLAIAAGCANTATTTNTPSAVATPAPTQVTPFATIPPATPNAENSTAVPAASKTPTASATSSADLDKKIGQMLMVGFRGLELKPDDPIVADIRERNVGAVVLFQYDAALDSWTRNIESPAQLQALNAALQQNAQTPLLISLDQEGGKISRLPPENGFLATQSEAFYGAKNDPAVTRAAAEAEGKLLRALNINLNLAPVVDLNLNPNNPIIGKYERSFSADPKVVSENASAEINGYHAQGILTTLKHFPGHGSSTSDSHQGFVDVTTTWQAIELEPYRNLINGNLADAVMTAHIFNSKLDPQYPATLSKKIITGILREQLHYDGVVITDDMQMGAIRQYYGFEQAVELALDAGVDMLAIANNLVYEPDAAARVIRIVKQMVTDGKITEQRIDQSYQRILRLKARIKSQ